MVIPSAVRSHTSPAAGFAGNGGAGVGVTVGGSGVSDGLAVGGTGLGVVVGSLGRSGGSGVEVGGTGVIVEEADWTSDSSAAPQAVIPRTSTQATIK